MNELRTRIPADPCEIAPSYISAIAAYQPGKPIAELAREFGLAERDIIKLASNENPLGLSPRAHAAMAAALPDAARYPDGNGYELKTALAARYGLPMAQIVLGNGSNDVLEMVAIAFLGPALTAVYAEHAFAVYPLATQARGARSMVVPARRYGHDLDAIRRAIDAATRVVFIANPNNPTGTFISGGDLEAFLREVPAHVVIVLDEAYHEYLPDDVRYDSVPWLERYRNLVITRTFSKIYGLAGLRVGYALCAANVADLLNRVRQPFNVNALALAGAVAALDDAEFVHRSYDGNRVGMRELTAGFKALGLDWIPSYGNFVSFAVPRRDGATRAGALYVDLLRRGVIVRPVASYGMPDHLRVTVGLPEENSRFLAALEAALRAA